MPYTATIPVDRIRPIIERAIEDRNDDEIPGTKSGNGLGGIERVAMDISRTTGTHVEAVLKSLWRVRTGWDNYNPKRVKDEKGPITPGQRGALDEAGIKYPENITAGQAYLLIKEKVKRRPYTMMTHELADTLITGLGLVHLWYTDLADIYFEGLEDEDGNPYTV